MNDKLWQELTAAMEERYGIEPTAVPPRGKQREELRFRKAGRTLLTLSPATRGFTALVVLGAAEAKRAFELELGPHVRGVLEHATQYHDGRWLFVPVKSRRDVRDVTALVELKRRPGR